MTIHKRYLLTGFAIIVFLISLVTSVRFARGTTGSLSSPNFKIKGAKDAPVHLIVCSDFQCPACQTVVQPIEELRDQFPNMLQIEFRHFPLERVHRWALTAASFAECAAEQGKFWEFHDRLFLEQSTWSQSEDAITVFAGYVRELQLDGQQFEACVGNPNTLGRIRHESSIGTKQGVQSTPTIFINGRPLLGSLQLKTTGRSLILEELQKLNVGEPAKNA